MIESRKFNVKQTLRVMSLAWVYMAVFLLPYIQYTFYIPMLKGLNVSNEQLGNLLSMYAIGCIIAYIPGGWLADRYSLKKILIISMIANVFLCLWITVSFTYTTALIVWPLTALTSGFACWAALIKGVGLSGTAKEQGKVWGMYEFFDSFLGLIVSYLNLAVFAAFESIYGIKGVFVSIAILSVIAAILINVFFEDTKEDEDAPAEKTKITDVFKVLKQPVIWYITFAILSNYTVYAGMTYFTPYLSDVIGLSIVYSGGLAILRSSGIRMLAGPTFGHFVDKSGSVSKVIMTGMLLTAILIVVFLIIPSSAPAVLLIGVFFIATFTLLGSRGVIFATLEEAKIPIHLRGLAIAVVSMIGYTPDLFIYKLFGSWLDTYGNSGYRMIFGTLIGMSIVTVVCCALLYRAKSKLKSKEV